MEEKIKQNNEENQGTTVKKLEGEKKSKFFGIFLLHHELYGMLFFTGNGHDEDINV